MNNFDPTNSLKLENSDKIKLAVCLAVIIAVNWFANFWNYSNFGLYVDDYTRVPQAMGLAHGSFLDKMHLVFSADLRIRPLHKCLIILFSLLGNGLGGLPGIYLIGYFISTANAILFFFLLLRIVDLQFFAITGALALCLYPIMTTKIWLTSLLGIQPALTLLIIALHSYLSNRKILSYILMILSLYCYETIFPVFIVAPLLKRDWNRSLLYELFKHLLISTAIFITFFSLKISFPDPRLQHLDYITTLQHFLYNSIAGPVFNIQEHLSIPIKNLLHLPVDAIALQIGSFFVLSLVFFKIGRTLENDPGAASHTITLWLGPNGVLRLIKGPLVAGLLMLVTGYAMTFYGNVHHRVGIASRIHTAAAPGMALVIAAISIGLLHLFSVKRKAYLPEIVIALLFSSLITYNFRVQIEYIDSRNLQRSFWSEVTGLCPDVTEGTLILVEPTGLKSTPAIGSINWSTSRILDKIYKFPHFWRYPPRVYLICGSNKDHTLPVNEIVTAGTVAKLAQMGITAFLEPLDIDRKVELSNTIVLTSEGGSLHRLAALQNASGESIALKAASARTPQVFAKGILYNQLIREPASR